MQGSNPDHLAESVGTCWQRQSHSSSSSGRGNAMSWFTRSKLYLSLRKALLRSKVSMGISVQKHEWGISTQAFVVLSVIFDAFPPAYFGKHTPLCAGCFLAEVGSECYLNNRQN